MDAKSKAEGIVLAYQESDSKPIAWLIEQALLEAHREGMIEAFEEAAVIAREWADDGPCMANDFKAKAQKLKEAK